MGCYTPLYIHTTNNARLRIVTVVEIWISDMVRYEYPHKIMSKEMTSKEKLLFIVSFIWAMHWGGRVAFAAISTFEMRFF